MKRWKLWMGILVIFLAGTCIGAVGTGLYVRHTVMNILSGGAPVMAELVSKRLASRLDLSDAQKVGVSQAIRETQLRLQELRRKNQPETERILSDGIARIKTELTPRQQAELDAIYARFTQRWNVNRKEAGPASQ